MSNTLREIILTAAEDHGLPLKDLTVLSTSRDPYRIDTPANHVLGQWLKDSWSQVCRDGRKIHLRGLHYRLVGQVNKPDGTLYVNDDDNWTWLSEKAVKASRYLGYLPWDALRDARITPPEWCEDSYSPAVWRLRTEDVWVSLPDDLAPRLVLEGTLFRQPWQQVLIAEKQGVADLLRPVCKSRHCSMVLPSGELSDQSMYDILHRAAEDGRPLVIHQLGDFDPSGYQMAVSTARTAQAIRDSLFPNLEVRVHAVALNLDQCQAWKLPSTPLKETERRADRWQERMGWEQTELDAAVALQPNGLVKAVTASLDQYFDPAISAKASRLRQELTEKANARLADHLEANIGGDTLALIRYQAEQKLNQIEEAVNEVNEALALDPADIGFPMPDKPPMLIGNWQDRLPILLNTEDDWTANTKRMIARKQYQEVLT